MKKFIISGIFSAVLFAQSLMVISCHSEETDIDIIDSVTPLLQKIIKQQNELKLSAKTETNQKKTSDSAEILPEPIEDEQNQDQKDSANIEDIQNQTQENSTNSTDDTNSSPKTDTNSENSEKPALTQEEESIPQSIPVDTTPPEKVTDIKAVNLDSAVSLTWKDPSDPDLFGIEITMTAPNVSLEESRTLEPLKTRTIIIAPETEYAFFNNLQNGTQYTFSFTALDTSGNRSLSSQKKITPKTIALAPMTIKLSASNSENENDSVKIEATITSLSPLYKVKFASESRTSTYFKSRGEEIIPDENGYSFYVNKTGTYTVYARDLAGRQETAEITIKKIPLNTK
ncbi:MAG: hypothetical protein IJL70_07045 [Treponema sp.]|nr:hypothetical protein [Treponema sp.]